MCWGYILYSYILLCTVLFGHLTGMCYKRDTLLFVIILALTIASLLQLSLLSVGFITQYCLLLYIIGGWLPYGYL